MSSVSWGNGEVVFRRLAGDHFIFYFENDGVIWYDAVNRIARDGWQKELEPYEGTDWPGYPFDGPAAEYSRANGEFPPPSPYDRPFHRP